MPVLARGFVALSLLCALPCQAPKSAAAPAKPAAAAKVDAPEPAGKDGTEPSARPSYIVRRNAPVAAGAGDHPSENAKLPATAAGLVTFDVTCQPSTVAPGDAGRLLVVLALRRSAVLLDPPPVEFLHAERQGPLLLTGQPRFRPAVRAGLAPALEKLDLYDDLAIFEVPFAVAADAAPGRYPLQCLMRYELLDGQKGGTLGRFTDAFGADVSVAAAPVAAAAAVTSAPRGGDDDPRAPAEPQPTRPAAGDDALQATPGDVAGAVAVADGRTEPPDVPPGEQASQVLLVVGGIGLLLLGGLLARRARRA